MVFIRIGQKVALNCDCDHKLYEIWFVSVKIINSFIVLICFSKVCNLKRKLF